MYKKIGRLLLLICLSFVSISYADVQDTDQALLQSERNTIDVFHRMAPFVVNVHNMQQVIDQFYQTYDVQRGVGSGFIWNKQGYIVTNYHVIQGASKIAVTLEHGKTLNAKVVGAEPRKDIAVLKLETDTPLDKLLKLDQIPLANSTKLLVGQKALAIGNPFGLDHTLTAGVISALGREVPGIGGLRLRDMIQTDASINPGNSGGPLFNSQGQLIGMNTAIYSKEGASNGVGFALPSNEIKNLVTQIIQLGKVVQPGIGFQPLNDAVAEELGIHGVIIATVLPDTPASHIGLRGTRRGSGGEIRLGDVVVAINNKSIKDYDDLYNVMSHTKVGDQIHLKIVRDGREKVFTLNSINLAE